MENVKSKNISLKVIATCICAILLFVAAMIVMPVSVFAETETAGSSLKNQVKNEVECDRSLISTYAADSNISKGEWREDSNGKWYVYPDGTYLKYTWRKIDGKWCYFNTKGYLVEEGTDEPGTIKGIDVSEWNNEIDWKAVKEFGIEYAFVRVGWGKQNLDRCYETYMKDANEAGVPVGVYYFSKAQSEEDALRDAQFVIDKMDGFTVSYPVVIDIEDESMQKLGKAEVGRIAKAFCDEIRRAGYTPMIYCNEYWYKTFIDWSNLQDVDKWIAYYGYSYTPEIKRDIWQCISTGRVDGIVGDVDLDFAHKDYSKIIKPRTKADESYYKKTGVWHYDGKGWWYNHLVGGYTANAWEVIDGHWYRFNSSGYRLTGWQNIKNVWYYFDNSGIMKTGFQNINGARYYFTPSGAMATGFQDIEGKRYYFNGSGAMLTGTGWHVIDGAWYYLKDGVVQTYWCRVGNVWYYFNSKGAMITGWQNITNSWYYFSGSGAMVTGWQNIGNTWYYFDGTGAMKTGFQEISGAKYYFMPSGAMITGWRNIEGTWYYFSGSGAMITGWQNIGNTWYYFDGTGAMKTGFQEISGAKYYFTPSGAMLTGWQNIEGTWYYFVGSGAMVTGWFEQGGATYYFFKDGKMAVGNQTIDGVSYNFGSNGKLQ